MAEINILDAIDENGVLTIIGTIDDDEIDTSDEIERVDVFADDGDDLIIAGDGENEIVGGAGQDIILGGVGNEFLYGGSVLDNVEDGSDLIDGGSGDDIIAGDAGNDELYGSEGFDIIFGDAGNDLLEGGEGDDDLFGGTGDDALLGGEGFDILYGEDGNDLLNGEEGDDDLFGEDGNDSLFGEEGEDWLYGDAGDDELFGGSNDDLLFPGSGNDFINGGDGFDLVTFDFHQADILNTQTSPDGQITLSLSGETKVLKDVEEVSFLDDTVIETTNLIQAVPLRPIFKASDGQGFSSEITPEVYDGPLSYLKYQFISDGSQRIIFGSDENDFLKLGNGDDAANGGDGRDVLDGGTGSNFLTGGNGDDSFFIQGLANENTWSTVTDFTSGDNVTAWGWIQGISQLIKAENASGAEGFKGATFHYDIDGNGLIDTSITFTGMTIDDISAPLTDIIDSTGYLYFA